MCFQGGTAGGGGSSFGMRIVVYIVGRTGVGDPVEGRGWWWSFAGSAGWWSFSSVVGMDGILGVVDTAVTSPWFYLVLFAVAAIDGFFPVVPSESLVITAGVYAASGRPELGLVVVLAALGAFTGDHVSFLLGRRAGGRLVRGLRPGTRRFAAFGWARRTLVERGGLILVVARYVPGGRTAVTVTMGAVGYRLRSFSLFAAVAAVSWGL